MSATVTFPLYVLADDQHMFMVESAHRVLYHMELIDIQNGEYSLWDADGRAVHISTDRNKVVGISHCDCAMSLAEAFKCYSETYGLNVDTTGPADVVWHRLQEAEARLPRRPSLLTRLFGKSAR
jgi:hypothetical protein